MSRSAILCVDDEAIILMSLKQELRLSLGNRYLYETALNAVEARAIVDDLEKDGIQVELVISDLLMPGKTGDTLLGELKQNYPHIKSIVITGHADRAALDKMQEVTGACRVFRKPWSNAELLSAVKECLGPESS